MIALASLGQFLIKILYILEAKFHPKVGKSSLQICGSKELYSSVTICSCEKGPKMQANPFLSK
jgi:hypothetical protein